MKKTQPSAVEMTWLNDATGEVIAKPSPWKPMHTCPKLDDATLYLFKVPHTCVTGSWDEYYERDDGGQGAWVDTNCKVIEPVLWMDVPLCSRAEYDAAVIRERKQ